MSKPYKIVYELDPDKLLYLYCLLEDTKFKMNNHREKSSGKGYTNSHGLVMKRPTEIGQTNELVIAKETLRNTALFNELHNIAESLNIDYTTIQVNRNYQTAPHKDIANSNDEDSYLFSIGDYTGGELCIEDFNGKVHSINANCKLVQFNGSLFTHWNEPHYGTKYSIVYYKNKRVCQEIKKKYEKYTEENTMKIMKELFGFVKSI